MNKKFVARDGTICDSNEKMFLINKKIDWWYLNSDLYFSKQYIIHAKKSIKEHEKKIRETRDKMNVLEIEISQLENNLGGQ